MTGDKGGSELKCANQNTAGCLRLAKAGTPHEWITMSEPVSAGVALVESILEGLPPGSGWTSEERTLLNQAARQADDIAALEADIAENGIRVPGSRAGHTVLNPAVSEVRQSRLALGKLLGALELPESASDTTRRAQRAAEARWRRAS